MINTRTSLTERAACGWCIPYEEQIKAELSAAIIPLSAAHIALYKAASAEAEEPFFGRFITAFSNPAPSQSRNPAIPPLPPTWLSSVAAFWQSLISRLEDPGLNDQAAAQTAQGAIERIPELIDQMDTDALADQFEAAMGQAAVISMRGRLRRRAYTKAALHTLSATGPALEGVAFAPMLEAVAKLERKTAITAALDSAQWSRVPLELRERAFFSAKVESVRFLSVAQRKLQQRLKLATEQLENGKTALVNRDSFIRDMRRIAEEEGIETTGPAGRGTIRDIRSVKRLGLIYDIQTESATGYARWKVDNDPDVLDEFPAYRLGPSSAEQPRPESYWRSRWAQAGASTGWQGAARTTMVALKTSPIWSALSTFGTPWPPFDYGSSRMLEDVDREEAAALGLVPRTGPVPDFGAKGSTPEAFNAKLEASTRGWPADQIATIKSAFGDQVQEQNGKLAWQGNLIGDLYDEATTDLNSKKSIDIGIATNMAINKAATLGVDLSGFTLQIKSDNIRHADKRHGPRSADRNPVTKFDIEAIPHVWRSPDEINQGAENRLLFKKNINKKLVFVEFVRSEKNKTLGINTIRRE
jgi:hypothetical protein